MSRPAPIRVALLGHGLAAERRLLLSVFHNRRLDGDFLLLAELLRRDAAASAARCISMPGTEPAVTALQARAGIAMIESALLS